MWGRGASGKCVISLCLSVCLSVFLSVCLSVCLSLSLSLSLSVCLSVCLSLSLSLSLSYFYVSCCLGLVWFWFLFDRSAYRTVCLLACLIVNCFIWLCLIVSLFARPIGCFLWLSAALFGSVWLFLCLLARLAVFFILNAGLLLFPWVVIVSTCYRCSPRYCLMFIYMYQLAGVLTLSPSPLSLSLSPLSVCLPACLSDCLSVCLSVCLPVCLSVSVSHPHLPPLSLSLRPPLSPLPSFLPPVFCVPSFLVCFILVFLWLSCFVFSLVLFFSFGFFTPRTGFKCM